MFGRGRAGVFAARGLRRPGGRECPQGASEVSGCALAGRPLAPVVGVPYGGAGPPGGLAGVTPPCGLLVPWSVAAVGWSAARCAECSPAPVAGGVTLGRRSELRRGFDDESTGMAGYFTVKTWTWG
jgi:hypothetical protein